MKKPVIAIPIGDPAGVGPEIVAKSIASDEVFQIAVCVIVGDRKIVEKAIEITGENLKINEIKEPEEAVDEKGVLNLINLDNVDMDTYRDLWSTDTYRRSVDNVRDEWNESILPDTSCIVKADAGYDQKRQDH